MIRRRRAGTWKRGGAAAGAAACGGYSSAGSGVNPPLLLLLLLLLYTTVFHDRLLPHRANFYERTAGHAGGATYSFAAGFAAPQHWRRRVKKKFISYVSRGTGAEPRCGNKAPPRAFHLCSLHCKINQQPCAYVRRCVGSRRPKCMYVSVHVGMHVWIRGRERKGMHVYISRHYKYIEIRPSACSSWSSSKSFSRQNSPRDIFLDLSAV